MNSHLPSLDPANVSLRDSWMKNVGERMLIGKIFGENGAEIIQGKTALAWLKDFRILDPQKALDSYTPMEAGAILISIAVAYNRASSMSSLLGLAAKTLSVQLDSGETDLLDKELKKYRPGGEYWDDVAKKVTAKQPPKEVLLSIAKSSLKEMRACHDRLLLEATFFQHIMESLETQRRCLKEYLDILKVDPSRFHGV